MSKAAKKSIFILMGLLIIAVVFAVIFFLDAQTVKNEKTELESALADQTNQMKLSLKKHAENTNKLKGEITKVNSEKGALEKKINDVQAQADQKIKDLSNEVSAIIDDRDKWKRRIDTIREERDKLMVKIGDLTKKLEEKPEPQIIYKEKEIESTKVLDQPPVDVSKAPSFLPDSGKVVDEEYWANLLKEKASLEVDIRELKEDLSEKSITVVEAKQKNEDLSYEVNTQKHEKEELEVTLQHKVDMIDNITLDLARTKNDKKFIANRVKKLNNENSGLRQEIKKLVSVKNALEKSIVRLTQQKDKVKNRLGRTEAIIQSKIDEIWEIKDDLDQSIRSVNTDTLSSNEVELPPIVVNSGGGGKAVSFNTGEAAPGLQGKVISVNEANNFVIVDVGEKSGINLGDNLSVYRDSKYIARLEVIQIRKDISAADLKDQWSKIRVGDVVR